MNLDLSEIVCRFCLKHNPCMWPLETIYRNRSNFLSKVYECTQINIIDLKELHTWVCSNCYKSIENFYTFKKTLQRNLRYFNESFLAEQKELGTQIAWHDDQLLQIRFDRFSSCDSYDETDDSITSMEQNCDNGLLRQTETGFREEHVILSLDSPNEKSIKCEFCKFQAMIGSSHLCHLKV